MPTGTPPEDGATIGHADEGAGSERPALLHPREDRGHGPLGRCAMTAASAPRIGVIGAGIVGLAVARRLAELRPDAKMPGVEKEDAVAVHQPGHNSGVAHAGLYYEPGSLKARLCTRGRG